MAATLNDEFVKGQKQWLKRAMKGRPLYFGLQAQAAKKGKFLVSKKPGEVKPAKVKELELYQGSGKDKDKAAEKNKVPGGAAMGVVQGEHGTLTMYFERGKALPVAEKFVKFFITREMKFKLVKKVRIAEVDQLPTVPDEDAADQETATAESVEARVKELAQRSKGAGGDEFGLSERLKLALDLAKSKPEQADDALDEVEFAVGTLERVTALQEQLKSTAEQPGVAKEPVAAIAKRILEARNQIKSEDIDGADDNLDVVEQSIDDLRTAAGLPEAGAAPESGETPQVDDEQGAAFFKDWLERIKPALKTLKDAKVGTFTEIGEHVKGVSEAVSRKDWQAAADSYKQADALITAALKRLRLEEAAPVDFEQAWPAARSAWDRAIEDVDGQIGNLQKALRASGDEELEEIAEYGLNAVTGNHKVKVMAAIQDVDRAGDANARQKAAAAAQEVVAEFSQHIASDERVQVCDTNPYGVKMSIQSTLGPALQTLDRTLRAAGE